MPNEIGTQSIDFCEGQIVIDSRNFFRRFVECDNCDQLDDLKAARGDKDIPF